jgi:hypothetical protein
VREIIQLGIVSKGFATQPVRHDIQIELAISPGIDSVKVDIVVKAPFIENNIAECVSVETFRCLVLLLLLLFLGLLKGPEREIEILVIGKSFFKRSTRSTLL